MYAYTKAMLQKERKSLNALTAYMHIFENEMEAWVTIWKRERAPCLFKRTRLKALGLYI